MQLDSSSLRKCLTEDLMNTVIQIGLIVFLIVMCARIFAPFSGIILWGLILAVALYPLHKGIAKRFGGRQGRAATVLVLFGLLVIGVPTVMLGNSFATHVIESYDSFKDGSYTVKQPNPSIADWPIIGEKIYNTWNKAADDLPKYLKENQPQVEKLSKSIFSSAVNTAQGILLFLVSLIIAGIMMAYGESGANAIQRIFSRVVGPIKGVSLQKLSTATIRSVATGVIGVAVIQALLLGVGFLLAGVPAAGVLALITVFLGIAQLPALILTIPVIAYMWSAGDASTTSNIIFSIYLLVAGTSDAILKPLLLGRGVNAPMPIILIGALGGMVTGGIIGLFIGAVLLTVGYKVFMAWVDDESEFNEIEQEHTENSSSSLPINE
jgi:predicted PurR-regulated permease PerM